MKLKSLIAIISLFFIMNLFAVPADKTPITIKQPNGKTLTFILQGDERISWAKTLDNYSLLRNKDGNWVYAILNEKGDMIPSNILACNKEERDKKEVSFLENIKTNLFYSQSQTDKKLNRTQEPQPQKDITPRKKSCCFRDIFRKKK